MSRITIIMEIAVIAKGLIKRHIAKIIEIVIR